MVGIQVTCTSMQFALANSAPPGPAAYSDSHTFRSRTYEPVGVGRWSDRHILEVILEGLPPREREAVRSRNGLAPNGPWEEVYVVSSEDMEADIRDFEWCLRTLVGVEDPGEEERGQPQRLPRVTYIRDIISECLEPLHQHMPEVFDVGRTAFYDSAERARLRDRITCLLAALYACQTLNMDSVDLRAYMEREHKSKQQLERTRMLVGMVERYRDTFVCVWEGERPALRTTAGACERW